MPGFTFSIRISNSAQVMAQVLGDEADVGVAARAPTDPRLAFTKMREDELVMLVGGGDRWARRRSVRMAELAGRTVILRERGSVTRDMTEKGLKAANVRTGQVVEVATREAVLEAVAAGLGVGVVFESEAGRDPRVRTIDIQDASVEVAEYAICRAEQRAVGLVGRFVDTALKLARENGWLSGPAA